MGNVQQLKRKSGELLVLTYLIIKKANYFLQTHMFVAVQLWSNPIVWSYLSWWGAISLSNTGGLSVTRCGGKETTRHRGQSVTPKREM